MASLRDLDALALALPEVTKDVSADGRPSYSVGGKTFCFHRRWRKDAPFDDVLVFRTDGSEPKELLLADLVEDAWLTRAPAKLAKSHLAGT